MRIAVDAMGGDEAPAALVEGGLSACQRYNGEVEIVFVGDQERIQKEIDQRSKLARKGNYSIIHASQVVEMGESPSAALKRKPDASIIVAQKLQKEGKVDAVVSAGHTGAAMASALLILGRLRGIHRPAIGTFIPSDKGATFLIDVGANVDSKPKNLVEFAIMGSIFISRIIGLPKPKVALLSIGEEREKGNELTSLAFAELEKANINFVGNIEGKDILKSDASVIVCDGFVGNVLLKFAESLIDVFKAQLKRSVKDSLWSMLGALLMRPAFSKIKKVWDYEEFGGVPLLGVNGVVIISHGRSTPKAIANAIYKAHEMVETQVNENIRHELETLRGTEVVSENA